MILKVFCTCRKAVAFSRLLMCVQLYCIYFNPLAVPVSMSQVMKLPVINIASIVEINFTGSVKEMCIYQLLKILPVRIKADSTNHDNA